MFLIAAIDAATVLKWTEVAIGLGLVIFVHELGHFAVAKLCGVKCEKFYLGFDVYGLKLFKFQWGETEYGIGALPLGGYVKMLGQDDNPARAYEEAQRAKLPQTETPAVEGWASERTLENESQALDPRSYLAQSVPKRMAIISAGVVMNLIFAVFLAALAYSLGVEYQPCIISGVVPGQAAWRAGLQVGDEVIRIGDVENPRYRDLQSGVVLGDLENGVHMTIDRAGQPPFSVVLKPDADTNIPMIGVLSPLSLKLRDNPAFPQTPAAAAQPALQGGDRLLTVDGQPLESYADLTRALALRPDQPLTFTVQGELPHSDESKPDQVANATGERSVTIGAQPVRHLGVQMDMAAIMAVQRGSLAETAGFQPGDRIVSIDGAPVGDPMTLPDRLRRRTGEEITFELRHGDDAPREVKITMPAPLSYEWPRLPTDNLPREISGLGIAYHVLNRVAALDPGSPAGKAGVTVGDIVVGARIIPPSDAKTKEQYADFPLQEITVEFDEATHNWPTLLGGLQDMPQGTVVDLTLKGGRTAKITPVESTDWFNPDRGLILDPLLAQRKATDLREAVVLGSRETLESTLQVYRFLQKLGHQISVTEIGGPISIARVAGAAAGVGFTQFLIFLVMLSTNLAVLNFLPIPMLDGGHMVFLILEGIRRKPVSEKVVLAFHYAGFLFLVTLMCFVFFLDFRRLF